MENVNANKKISTWQAACIITGYGIGAGVLAMPYMAEKVGFIGSMVLLFAACGVSLLLHLMIADLTIKTGIGSQVVSVFSKFMFRGKLKTFFTVLFFGLMAVVLCANLAAYIAGAADVLADLLGIDPLLCKIIFYAAAASVVLFGLKAVAVSETVMVTVIFALIATLGIASFINPLHSLPFSFGGAKDTVSYFSMAMLAFGAFFSVPQAVEGLGGDEKEIKKAITWGLGNNLIIMIVVIIGALIASPEVTEVGMIGWSKGIGLWAQIVGSAFTLFAMLTTYWSVSLALSDIVKDQFKLGSKICWVFATIPSLVLSVATNGDFLDFLNIAAGAIAIIIALLLIPCFNNARREIPGSLCGKFSSLGWQITVAVCYVLMAIGSVL